ncbi:class I SAM-dependent methyltransferase [Oceanibium sediminis]|uniref:class I SAM-dependent methyltransferase n=1 Tax=Oceanibium sediminis TaxID=2026339 RepID=UPI000DD46510|nr:methyltransferase domain-containing protein [Oceanibium sediminis]
MDLEAAVAAHYTTDDLLGRIEAALRADGKDPDNLNPEDIVPLEHMHTGGLRATRAAITALRVTPSDLVADIGCGIGGTTRELVRQTGARAIGIDLTPDLVAVARELSRRTGFADKTEFLVGSALELPLKDNSVDAAIIMHIGMNIRDKRRMISEAARVLRPGAPLALWDVMLGDVSLPVRFPVPWAQSEATSHLAPPQDYREAAAEAGLHPEFEQEYYTETLSAGTRTDPAKPPAPLGPHLMMGANAPEKIRNHKDNMNVGAVVPVQMLFRKPD